MKNSTMTREQKDLLLKDLCARLPYGTMVYAQNATDWYDSEICTQVLSDVINEDYIVKPYLFPLSSMTEEQRKEFDRLLELELKALNDEIDHIQATAFEVDFYHKHHLDWRGLIPKSLATDATGLNIY